MQSAPASIPATTLPDLAIGLGEAANRCSPSSHTARSTIQPGRLGQPHHRNQTRSPCLVGEAELRDNGSTSRTGASTKCEHLT